MEIRRSARRSVRRTGTKGRKDKAVLGCECVGDQLGVRGQLGLQAPSLASGHFFGTPRDLNNDQQPGFLPQMPFYCRESPFLVFYCPSLRVLNTFQKSPGRGPDFWLGASLSRWDAVSKPEIPWHGVNFARQWAEFGHIGMTYCMVEFKIVQMIRCVRKDR